MWSRTSPFDFVPCDNVANVVLAAAAEVVASSAGPKMSSSSAMHPGYATSIPVLHASTSTNNPVTFFEVFRNSVFPHFSAHPAPSSLKVGRHGVYVTPESPSLYVREGSLRFWALTFSKSTAMSLRCAALRLAGRRDTARRLAAGFRAYLIYRSSKLDFGLFYCSARGAALVRALPAEERRRFALLFEGDWTQYAAHHCKVGYFFFCFIFLSLETEKEIHGKKNSSFFPLPLSLLSPPSQVISAKYFGERGTKQVASVSVAAATSAAATSAAAVASSKGEAVEAPRAAGRGATPKAVAPATAVFASVAVADDEGASASAQQQQMQAQQQMSTILRTISSLGVVAS